MENFRGNLIQRVVHSPVKFFPDSSFLSDIPQPVKLLTDDSARKIPPVFFYLSETLISNRFLDHSRNAPLGANY